MKKYIMLLSLILLMSITFAQVLDIHYFYGETCPHCSKVKPTLDELEQKYEGKIDIHRYEIYNNAENRELFNKFLSENDIGKSGVPALFVAGEFLVGSKQIPDSLEGIIVENINSQESDAEETIRETNGLENKNTPNNAILNQLQESDDTMVGVWGFIQNPFFLLVVIAILVVISYKLYINSNKKKLFKSKKK